MDADEVSRDAVWEASGRRGPPNRGGGTFLHFVKLKELKIAYADILLGISQEAGARVMESDRKSARCKYELEATRYEGVRLLERLKHMMESQIIESQTTALNQQKKIDELEAQLQEAEDIVSDLRGELQQVQAELERVIKNKNSNKPIFEIPQMNVNNIYPYQSSVPYPSQLNGCGKCCNKMVCTCGAPHYLPSIILRGKETGLYRNGCTQRIHACERNPLNQDLNPLNQDLNPLNQDLNPLNQDLSLSEKKDVLVEDKEKRSKELENKSLVDIKFDKFDSFPMKRKRARRHRKTIIPLAGKISHLSKDGSHSDVNPSDNERNLVEASDGKTMHEGNGKMDVEKIDGLSGSLELNSPKVDNGLSGRPVRERDFKFTFQRRRKRQAMSKLDAGDSLETWKKIGDRKPEEIKRSLLLESAQDSRWLAQVARQLISLSESK